VPAIAAEVGRQLVEQGDARDCRTCAAHQVARARGLALARAPRQLARRRIRRSSRGSTS